MIQIINKTETYKIICSECDCEFTYEWSDITKNYYEQKVVKCPHCGSNELHSTRQKTEVKN